MYKDIVEFTEAARNFKSTLEFNTGTNYILILTDNELQWMVDIVAMSTRIGPKKYLVLARVDLANQAEGWALRRKTSSVVCQFLLEEVFCRYGCVSQVIVDRGELNSDEAKDLFAKHGVWLTLTTAYNPEPNRKIERGHSPILKALAKACDEKVKLWPQMLLYALWADRTTHSSVNGCMPTKIMTGQAPVMPTETAIGHGRCYHARKR